MEQKATCGLTISEPLLQTFCLEIDIGHDQTLQVSVIVEAVLKGPVMYKHSFGPFKGNVSPTLSGRVSNRGSVSSSTGCCQSWPRVGGLLITGPVTKWKRSRSLTASPATGVSSSKAKTEGYWNMLSSGQKASTLSCAESSVTSLCLTIN